MVIRLIQGKKKQFLDHYRKLCTISKAAEATGIARKTFYNWLEQCSTFKAEFTETKEAITEMMEAEALRRAYNGVEEPVYQGKELVGHITKYSDTLLIFLLKANRPEVYRERIESHVDVTTKGEKIVGNRDIPANALADTIAILERSRIPALAGNQN